MKRMLLGLMVLLGTQSAMAAMGAGEGVHVGLSVVKWDESASGDNFSPAQKDNRTLFDVKLGYLMSNSLYLGGLYSSYNGETTNNTSTRTAMGATVGYHTDGFYFDVSYLLNAEYKVSSTTSYKEGSGFGFDFGYNVPISSSFYIGAQLDYKSISYKKINASTANNTFTELAPMFNLGFYF